MSAWVVVVVVVVSLFLIVLVVLVRSCELCYGKPRVCGCG